MGVACKYSRFGLSANSPSDASATAEECAARRMAAKRNTPAQTKHADEGMAPARPLRHSRSFRTERQHQHMRQRQPDGADLVVAGRARIHDAARDVEMRLRIAVIQSPAGMIYVRGSQAADRGQRDEDQREFEPDASSLLQNSVKSRNSWKRASISSRVSVRKRSTPNFSQQKLPITEP